MIDISAYEIMCTLSATKGIPESTLDHLLDSWDALLVQMNNASYKHVSDKHAHRWLNVVVKPMIIGTIMSKRERLLSEYSPQLHEEIDNLYKIIGMIEFYNHNQSKGGTNHE